MPAGSTNGWTPTTAGKSRNCSPGWSRPGPRTLAVVLRADHRDMIRLAGQALDPGAPEDTRHPSEPARRLLDLIRHHVDTEQNRVMPLLQGRQPSGPEPGAGYHTPPRWPG